MAARRHGIDVRLVSTDRVGISVDETTSEDHLAAVAAAFEEVLGQSVEVPTDAPKSIPDDLQRPLDFLTHEWFGAFHSETAMMRYLRRLSDLDLAWTGA